MVILINRPLVEKSPKNGLELKKKLSTMAVMAGVTMTMDTKNLQETRAMLLEVSRVPPPIEVRQTLLPAEVLAEALSIVATSEDSSQVQATSRDHTQLHKGHLFQSQSMTSSQYGHPADIAINLV